MKKVLTALILFLAINGKNYAEDFPVIEILGSSPDAEFISTIQSVETDGKGDVIVEIRIYDSWGNSVYKFETAQECLLETCVEAAKSEAIEMNLQKLQKFKIDSTLKGIKLYTYQRAESSVGESYDFPTQLGLSAGAYPGIKLSYAVGGDVDFRFNKLVIKRNPSSEDEDVFISNLNLEYPKVGAESVILIQGAQGKTRLAVVSAFQSEGFEGPNTEFQLNLFDL